VAQEQINLSVPKSGNFMDMRSQIWEQIGRHDMNVIGANKLSEYGKKHPKALPAMQALHALIAHASWTGRKDIERDCGAIARFRDDGGLEIDLNDRGCRVTLAIHYGVGVARILTVTEL
jgi:mRNA-degrading endonuclease HigB of HigAB toxin-antitoxin module